MIKRWNFSRVGYKVILHSKFSSEQTFENLYQFISAVNWSVIANISRKIFSKVSLLLNWLCRMTVLPTFEISHLWWIRTWLTTHVRHTRHMAHYTGRTHLWVVRESGSWRNVPPVVNTHITHYKYETHSPHDDSIADFENFYRFVTKCPLPLPPHAVHIRDTLDTWQILKSQLTAKFNM